MATSQISSEDLADALAALNDGAASVERVGKRGPAARKIEEGRVRGLVRDHVELLAAYAKDHKDAMDTFGKLAHVPAMFFADIFAGRQLARQIRADQPEAKPARTAAKASAAPAKASRSPRRPSRASTAVATPRRRSAPARTNAGKPVSVCDRPIGTVGEIYVIRQGKLYRHVFGGIVKIHAVAGSHGILVLRGAFKVDQDGFIHDAKEQRPCS